MLIAVCLFGALLGELQVPWSLTFRPSFPALNQTIPAAIAPSSLFVSLLKAPTPHSLVSSLMTSFHHFVPTTSSRSASACPTLSPRARGGLYWQEIVAALSRNSKEVEDRVEDVARFLIVNRCVCVCVRGKEGGDGGKVF